MITKIEELSLNAWASLQTVLYDGWVIRFADGYTKRANSVNPIYSSSLDIEEKISFCEQLYLKKNLPVVYKMTSAVFPADLDEKLQAKGYRIDSPTSIQTLHLSTVQLQGRSDVEIQTDLSDDWVDGYCRMSNVSKAHRETLRNILVNIVPDRCFVSIKSEDRIVACGLGVLQSGHIGLFDIVTDKGHRNRGHGRQIVESILHWGKQNKAQTAYLQVMLDNEPALRLYSRIGFEEQYQYWYRIKS